MASLHWFGHRPSFSIRLYSLTIFLIASSEKSPIKCGLRLAKDMAVWCLKDLAMLRSCLISLSVGSVLEFTHGVLIDTPFGWESLPFHTYFHLALCTSALA